MARTIPEIVAVPGRLPLGCQRESLYFSLPRAKEGGRADARVPNGLATASKTDLKEGHLMCAYRDRPGEPRLSKVISLALVWSEFTVAD